MWHLHLLQILYCRHETKCGTSKSNTLLLKRCQHQQQVLTVQYKWSQIISKQGLAHSFSSSPVNVLVRVTTQNLGAMLQQHHLKGDLKGLDHYKSVCIM